MRGADRVSLHALTNLAGAETCDHIIEHPVVLLHRGELGGDYFSQLWAGDACCYSNLYARELQ